MRLCGLHWGESFAVRLELKLRYVCLYDTKGINNGRLVYVVTGLHEGGYYMLIKYDGVRT